MYDGLFRQQAVEHHVNRLHGDVILFPKISHVILVTAILIWVAAVVLWLVFSSYARKETVAGWLEPPAGVIRVYAESFGIIKQILVKEGDHVIEDQPLLVVNGDQMLADGGRMEKKLLDEFENQRRLLNEQLDRTRSIFHQRLNDINKRLYAADNDLGLINSQLVTLEERLELINTQVHRHEQLFTAGHISMMQLDESVANQLAIRSERQQLLREKINSKNKIVQYQTEAGLLADEREGAINDIQNRMSDLAQRITHLHGQQAYIVRATKSGIVNGLQVQEGQRAGSSSAPLLTIIPEDVEMVAHLLIPVRSIGFVEIGQEIDVRYDAFPYQKFGLYKGELTSISSTVSLENELFTVPVPAKEPVYRVTAKLGEQFVTAYGKQFSLKSGMTISADVRLDERTIMQWLLEPIYSLRGRI